MRQEFTYQFQFVQHLSKVNN